MGQWVLATDTWLQVVGINESDRSQNYTAFYEESEKFTAACQANPNRQCIKFINAESKLAKDPVKVSKLTLKTPDYAGPPKDLLGKLDALISSAKDGDKIFLAFQNHGAPVFGNPSTSCVYYSSSERICDQDLKYLVASAKPGVKIAIFVDACYSGGFINMLPTDIKNSVCMVVSADQHSIGWVNSTNLWTHLKNQRIKTLADIPKLFESEQTEMKVGSQVMEENRCQILNIKVRDLLNENDFAQIFYLQRLLHLNQCESNSYLSTGILSDLESMAPQFKRNTFILTTEKVCKNQNDDGIVDLCQSLRTVASRVDGEMSILNEFASAKKLVLAKEQLQAVFEIELKPAVVSNRTAEFFNYEREPKHYRKPNFKGLTSTQIDLVKKSVRERQGAILNLQNAERDFFVDVEKLKSTFRESSKDIQKLISCLSKPIDDTKPNNWDAIARKNRKRLFTENMIMGAKECEESFSML
jgi:hypothetical protein